ncbi:hypothetical protein BKA80DRAFT_280724, partial [Phyllosticta citrichinensis]
MHTTSCSTAHSPQPTAHSPTGSTLSPHDSHPRADRPLRAPSPRQNQLFGLARFGTSARGMSF